MHLVGAGIIDMGIFGVVPTIDHKHRETPPIPSYNYTIPFSKEDEIAEPGYYSTLLQD